MTEVQTSGAKITQLEKEKAQVEAHVTETEQRAQECGAEEGRLQGRLAHGYW
jgi:hypothetical protein